MAIFGHRKSGHGSESVYGFAGFGNRFGEFGYTSVQSAIVQLASAPLFYSFLTLAISPLMELIRVKLYCPLVDPLISRLK